MTKEPVRRCPDCGFSLQRIRVQGRTADGTQGELCYSVDDAVEGFVTGRLPIQAKIRGLLCHGCGRVLLYSDRFSHD